MCEAFVYIITNKNNTVLYAGSTKSLKKRVYHHKHRLISGFSKNYNLDKLVYYEAWKDHASAVRREIQLKKGSRKAKIEMIERTNPQWLDLYERIE